EQRVAGCGALELLQRGVRVDAKEADERIASNSLVAQDEGRLAGRQLARADPLGAASTGKHRLARYPQIAYPVHDAIGGRDVALPVALDGRYQHRARLPALAPTHRQQVHRIVAKEDART